MSLNFQVLNKSIQKCISGIPNPGLNILGHIIPWSWPKFRSVDTTQDPLTNVCPYWRRSHSTMELDYQKPIYAHWYKCRIRNDHIQELSFNNSYVSNVLLSSLEIAFSRQLLYWYNVCLCHLPPSTEKCKWTRP